MGAQGRAHGAAFGPQERTCRTPRRQGHRWSSLQVGQDRRRAQVHCSSEHLIRQTQKAHIRKFYAGKKYVPIDVRPKKTRAIRRQLSKAQLEKRTLRETKKSTHFPMRKYAVKA